MLYAPGTFQNGQINVLRRAAAEPKACDHLSASRLAAVIRRLLPHTNVHLAPLGHGLCHGHKHFTHHCSDLHHVDEVRMSAYIRIDY